MENKKDSQHQATDQKQEGESEVAGAVAGVARTLSRILTRALASIGRGGIAGTLSGMAEETAGYPLDLVKTRMQVHGSQGSGVVGIVKETVQKEGFGGLFKGLGPPFVASAFITATIFGTYARALDVLEERAKKPLGQEEPQIGNVVLSGGAAGFAQAFITCPVDLIKSRMQVAGFGHGHSGGIGNIEMAKQVVKTRGFAGLYHGMVPTLWRDVPGYAAFFSSYEILKRTFTSIPLFRVNDDATAQASGDQSGHGAEGLSPIAVILAGGIAGMIYHSSTYPFDVIKSRIQTQGETNLYKGTLDCMRALLRSGGWRALTSGFVPTVARSFPANAIGFLVYEVTLKLLP